MYQFRQEDIKVFNFAEGAEQAASEVGLIVVRGGKRPHFLLCEIAENNGFHAGANIIPVCMTARDLFAKDLSLSEISWQYINGYGSSTFDFKMAGNWPLFISCEHGWPFSDTESKTPLGKYPALVNERLGRTEIGPESSQTAVILPMDVAHGYMCMEWEELDRGIYPHSKQYLVDTERFAAVWLPQIETSDPQLFSRLNKNDAAEYLVEPYASRAPFDYALELPYISYQPDSQNTFGFTNGNHRTLYLIACEAPFIPMHVGAMDDAAHADFAAKFGWRQGDNLKLWPQIGYSTFEQY